MRGATPTLQLTLSIAGVLAFTFFFFSLGLPNAGWIPRWHVWWYAIPGLDADSTSLPVDALGRILNLRYFHQRLPILAYASLIVVAATGAGIIGLRLLGIYQLPSSDTVKNIDAPRQETALTSGEQLLLAFGAGMSMLSLVTFGCGLAGSMNRWVFLFVLLALAGTAIGVSLWTRFISGVRTHPPKSTGPDQWVGPVHGALRIGGVIVAVAFLAISLLGAALPATDFDVREYHLQGPKEFYQAGRLFFMPHNVYTAMPFATGMSTLLGMIVAGDWWWGALVGQVVLACYAPMTALGVFFIGRRLYGHTAGLVGAIIYLTTPWVYRISIIPYTENALSFYLMAGTLAVLVALERRGQPVPIWLLGGFMAGTAAACKYPALMSTVLPLGAVAVGWSILKQISSPTLGTKRISNLSMHGEGGRIEVEGRRGFGFALCRSFFPFTLGVICACSPWLVKNWVVTGNPTYPLLYRVFGGRQWSPEKNAKWEWGHRVPILVALGLQHPPDERHVNSGDPQHAMTWRRLGANLIDVTVQADWQSPLLFGFAPWAFFNARSRRASVWLWIFVVFLFFQWWLFTHRLDRFWVPLLPIAAVLAGAGATWNARPLWKSLVVCVVALVTFFNFSFCTTGLCGYNDYSTEIVDRTDPLPADIPRDERPVNVMNRELPPDARVLAVGAADLFHLNRQLLYNTVFDDSIFEQLMDGREPAAANAALQARGITHVYVNWSEVLRYREPGSYGFTDFVTPQRFEILVQSGVLVPMRVAPAFAGPALSINGRLIPARQLFKVGDKSPAALE